MLQAHDVAIVAVIAVVFFKCCGHSGESAYPAQAQAQAQPGQNTITNIPKATFSFAFVA